MWVEDIFWPIVCEVTRTLYSFPRSENEFRDDPPPGFTSLPPVTASAAAYTNAAKISKEEKANSQAATGNNKKPTVRKTLDLGAAATFGQQVAPPPSSTGPKVVDDLFGDVQLPQQQVRH